MNKKKSIRENIPMKNSEINIRDPFVLVDDGKYYLYGTRGATCWGPATGFDVYVSTDLENWGGPFIAFENDGSFWANRNYWAPEVHKYQGAYYMFASFKNDERCRGTQILKADTPMGPFRPITRYPVTPENWECLDGTFYLAKNGTPYIVFCHEWVQVGNGEICAMPLTRDLTAPAGEPFVLFRAHDAAWANPVHHSGGMDGYVTDGPFLWRTTEDKLELLWASFSDGGYTEGVAVSSNDDITGTFVQSEPLFDKDGGHGMVFKTTDNRILLTLHSPNAHEQERPVFTELVEENGLLKRK